MIRIYFIICIVILLSACDNAESDNVKFSGVYATNCSYSGVSTGSKQWLRFFPNDKVTSTLTVCEARPENLIKWFHLDNDSGDFYIGSYKINGDKVEMSFFHENGSIEYTGLLQLGTITFTWESSITGSVGKEEYHFIELN